MILLLILMALVYVTAASYLSMLAGMGALILMAQFGGGRLRRWQVLAIGLLVILFASQVAL